MELWIRSQNKEKLVLSRCIFYHEYDRDYYGKEYVLTDENVGIIGGYKSKERALEVLDEIQRALILDYKSGFGINDGTPLIFNKTVNAMVYEMPKE